MDGPDDGTRNCDRSDARADRPGSRSDPAGDSRDRGPAPGARSRTGSDDAVRIEDGVVRWFLETDDRTVAVVRDIATILTIVGIVFPLLFGVSGAWPALVAVESGSMEPNIQQGDLVFVVDDGRFTGENAVAGTGIVTLESGRDGNHEQFGQPGDAILFLPNGDPAATPVIHRAHFWVEANENWVQTKADSEFLHGATCADIVSCPAPHDGFVTKGDANPRYDQLPRSGAETTVVSPDWVTSKAMVRVPWLGQIRLTFDSIRSLEVVGSNDVFVTTGSRFRVVRNHR